MKKLTEAEYKAMVDHAVNNIQKIKMMLYEAALEVISSPDSYTLRGDSPTAVELAKTDLKQGIDALGLLLNRSGNDGVRRLQTLYDLTNEDYVCLYPITLLTHDAAEKIAMFNEAMAKIQAALMI